MRNAIGLAVISAVALGGCAFDFGGWWSRGSSSSAPYYEPEPYYYDDYRTLTIQDGVLRGDMGDYTGFDAPAYEQTGYTSSYDANVTLHGGSRYWVMTSVSVTGGLDHADFEPGRVLVFDDSTRSASYYSGSGTVTPHVEVVGCSGPSHGNYTFDTHADQVIVQVEPGRYDGEKVFHFTARFDNFGTVQTTTGSFVYDSTDTVARR